MTEQWLSCHNALDEEQNIWNEWRSEWVLFKIKIMFISSLVDINKTYLV